MTNVYTNVYQHGSNLYVRYIEDGRRYARKVDFRPTLWVSGGNKDGDTEWRNLNGHKVYPVQPGTMYDCRQFIDKYKDVHGFDVYESPGHVYQYIAENYLGELRFNSKDVQIFSLDIETTVDSGFPEPADALEQITLLTVKDTRHNKFFTWGTNRFGEFKNPFKHVEYRSFSSEQALLMDFISWWQQNYPDAVTGWNTGLFDITYLYNRMSKVIGEDNANKISPWGKVRQREVDMGGRIAIKTYIAGIASLDYLDLYKKFTYITRESYKLDYITSVELDERKVENPGSSFQDFYTNHWQTFVEYNIRDVELVDKLDAKLKLIDLALTIAYAAKVNYEDVFSPVRTWDVLIYNYLNEQHTVIPIFRNSNTSQAYAGGYVKEPLIGKHKWVISFDLDSLYPHIMMGWNISPETVSHLKLDVTVDDLLTKGVDLSLAKAQNYSVAANGWCFEKDRKGLLPTLMQLYYDKRVLYKKEMIGVKKKYEKTKDPKYEMEIAGLHNMQMAMKILLNSVYGATANAYFRYFDIRIAEGITLSGQLAIRWIATKLNAYFNNLLRDDKDRIVLIDTDSAVLVLDDLVQKVFGDRQETDKVIQFLDDVSEQKIQPYINASYEELADYINAYEQKMHMKRENLVDVMVSVGKKHYAMSVCDSEGVRYKEPQLKVMGLQMVKSNTPAVVRDKLRGSLDIILRGTESEVQQYVANYKQEFEKLSAKEIAFPRGTNNLTKYKGPNIYTKGTPIHVRGSLLYNHYLKEYKVSKLYPEIQGGDKIKFVYLKLPNPIHEDCIAFVDELPKEFELHDYIDYNKMFEVAFVNGMQNVLDALKWSAIPKATIDDWFE